MRAPWKRAAAIALATCGISFLPLISGCKTDIDKDDEQVREHIETATTDLGNGHSDEAVKNLKAISSTKGGSPESQIEYNRLLAQSEVDAADALIRRLGQQDAQIAGLLGRMQTLAWQIGTNNANIAGYQNLNPTQGEQAYQQAATAAQQGEGGAWVKGEPPIPSLADVKQRTDDLQKKINDLTQQKNDLTARRAEALQSAGKFDQQADSTTGKDSVGFYTQASNQRKEAADDDTKIRQLDSQLLPLQQQLAVAQLQQKAIDSAIASFQQQGQQLQANWQAIQKQIEATRDYSKALLQGGGSSSSGSPTTAPSGAESPSLSSLAGELDQNLKSAEDLRNQATSLLISALAHYKAAEEAAGKRVTALTAMVRSSPKLPEKQAWQEMINLNQPAAFKLPEAGVYGRLARLYVDQYIELAQRNALARVLSPALKQAGLEGAGPITSIGSGGAPDAKVREQLDKLEADMAKGDFGDFAGAQSTLDQLAAGQVTGADQQAIAGARADLNYYWADSLLNDIIQTSGGAGDMAQLATNLAHVDRMIDYYGWSQFATIEGKEPNQKGRLATAQSEYKALSDANALYLLPAVLPPNMAPAPATTQPTTQPGEGATSQPTTGPEGGATTQPAATEPTTTAPAQ